MFQKRIALIITVLAFSFVAKAQFVNDYVAAADKYYANGDYYSASQYYEKALGSKKSKTGKQSFQPYDARAAANRPMTVTSANEQQVIYNLAESYRKLHFHVKALPYYQKASGFDPASFPLAKYHYATTLRALEQYDEAADMFNQFLAGYSRADMYADNAKRELNNITYIKEQLAKTDLDMYTLQKNRQPECRWWDLCAFLGK